MKEGIINFLLLLFSWSPVFSFTNDKNYGEIKINSNSTICSQIKEWRISLIQVMLGAYKIYLLTVIITYDAATKKLSSDLSLYKILSLKDVCDNSAHIQEIYNNYFTRLKHSAMTKHRLEAEKESLCYHIEIQNNRIEKSDNKMNIYTTVVLTLLPVLLGISFESILSLLRINMIYKIIFIIAAYFIINIVCYLFQYIKVGSYSMSSFNDLKSESDSNLSQRLISQYYYDFQSLKSKADMFVSYIINIQYWMIASLVLFVGAFFYHQIHTYISTVQGSVVNSNSSICTVDITALSDPYSQSSIQLTDIRKCIQTQCADKVIIMYNSQSDISIIINELQMFDLSFEIEYLNDDQLGTDDAKILVYKERTP